MGTANLRHAQEYDWAHVAARVRDEYLMTISNLAGQRVAKEPSRIATLRRPVTATAANAMNAKHAMHTNVAHGADSALSQIDGA
jgi:hypothetical protein